MGTPAYTNGDYTVATAIGPKVKSYPFRWDRESFIFTQPFEVLNDHFARLALDTPDEEILDAFLVDESDPINDGPVVRWTRTYAQIPQSRTEMESYAWTLPGITADSVAQQKVISSASHSGGYTTINTSTAHGFVVGDEVIIYYWVTDASVPGWSYNRQVYRVVAEETDADTFKVNLIIDPTGVMTFDQVYKNVSGREPFTRVVPSYLQFDYFLPGVSAQIDTAKDIAIFEPIHIIDNTGNETDSLSATTIPTKSEYRELVRDKELIVAEPSIVKRWQGNIYERVTRYVVAI